MKKILLSLLCSIFLSTQAFALTPQYLCTSGGTWSGSIWVLLTANQAACTGGTTYTNTDTATLNAASGSVTLAANQTAAGLDETGYAGTLTINSGDTLTISAGDPLNIQGGFAGTGTIAFGTGGMTLLATPTGSVFPFLTATAAGTITSGGFTWPGNLSLTGSFSTALVGKLTIGGTLSPLVNQDSFTGAYDIQANTFTWNLNSSSASRTFTMPGAQTLTVTNAINLISSPAGNMTLTIQSSNSTNINLTYTGTTANENISGMLFTHVNASGSTGGGISNFNGSTLTSTTGITNCTLATCGGSSTGSSNGYIYSS